MEVADLYLITASIIGFFFPIYSLWGGPKAKVFLVENPTKLVKVFQEVILTQVGLTALVFLSLFLNKESVAVIGLSFLGSPGAIIALFAISFLFLWAIRSKQISESEKEKIKQEYAEIMYLIPKTRKEFHWSIALSFVAGTFEEILYRGFLFWQLSLYLPFVVALLLTNIIFGLLHVGTGMKNALSTFGLGMIYSALSIPFDTLWLAILAHILTDLYAIGVGFKLMKNIRLD